MQRRAQQFNGREAKTTTLNGLPAYLCFCSRHLKRWAASRSVRVRDYEYRIKATTFRNG